jgi:hypothetical protein
MDFKKYKNYLKQYLSKKGYDISQNPMFCFNPSHNNKNTPACVIYDDNFQCESCGIRGDIFDACEILTGIKEKSEQYKEVEKTLKGYTIEKYDLKTEPKKEKYKPDSEALKKLIDYMRNHGGRLNGVMAFLKKRGYTPDIAKKMYDYFGYWPGFEIACKEVDKEILKKAGIPARNYKTNKSSWDNSGVVVKLNQGLKLCYYYNDKCEKRNSKGAFTFPISDKLDKHKSIILVEAEITEIAMKAIGLKNVFATGGTNGLTIKILKEKLLSFEGIIFAFDGDEGGRKASGIIKTEKGDKKKCYPEILLKEGFKGIIKIANFPDEKDPDDLIRENKIGELKSIIENAKIYIGNKKVKIEKVIDKQTKDVPFIFMGFDSRSYYVIPHNQNIVLKVNRGENYLKNWLKEIAPFEWWYEYFQKENEDGEAYFNLAGSLAWFRKTSISAGIYNENRIRGLGAHKDGDNIVFNNGEKLYVNNKIFSYNDFCGEHVYCRSKIKLKIEGKEWSIQDGIEFMKQLKTFKFERMIDYMIISGFMAFSWLASILYRRPSIWITGKSGSGKSFLLTDIIKIAIGENQSIYTEGKATEAYIRQKAGIDCRIPIVDEFEAHNKSEKIEQKKIMTLMRSCYGGTNIGKGTPEGKPLDFNTKMMFCFASVNIFFDNDGDKTRVAICRLVKKDDNDKNYFDFKKSLKGLKIRIYNRLKQVNKNVEIARNLILQSGYDNRSADTYAPFLAGFWMIISDNPFFQDKEQIKNYILKAIEEIKETDHKNDEDKILERILQERIKLAPDKELTISEMLIEKKIDSSGEEVTTRDNELRRYGLRRFIYRLKIKYESGEEKTEKKESLAIEANHPAIRNILKDTSFQDYKEVLQRHQFVLKRSEPVYMAGKTARCILFDWDKLYEEYFREKKDDDIPF